MPLIQQVDFFRATSPLSRPIADSTHPSSEPGWGFAFKDGALREL